MCCRGRESDLVPVPAQVDRTAREWLVEEAGTAVCGSWDSVGDAGIGCAGQREQGGGAVAAY